VYLRIRRSCPLRARSDGDQRSITVTRRDAVPGAARDGAGQQITRTIFASRGSRVSPLQVAQIELAAVELRHHVDDPACRGGSQQRQQQLGQQERREVAGRPGELEPIRALLAAAESGTGVVDQDVDVTVPVADRVRDPADVGLHGQVGGEQHRRSAGRGLGDLRAGVLAAGLIALCSRHRMFLTNAFRFDTDDCSVPVPAGSGGFCVVTAHI
jgi:hypothetical protein